ncbi:MAG TPA: ATP-binding protein [Actinomycetota bacterium]|nr:ATP-binding protein [Actinomycetota bacterium]
MRFIGDATAASLFLMAAAAIANYVRTRARRERTIASILALLTITSSCDRLLRHLGFDWTIAALAYGTFMLAGYQILLFRVDIFPIRRRIQPWALLVTLATTALGATFSISEEGPHTPAGVASLALSGVLWIIVLGESCLTFWRASRHRQLIQRARLRALVFGYLALMVLLSVRFIDTNAPGVDLLAAPLPFFLYMGLSAPAWLRRAWRRHEEDLLPMVVDLISHTDDVAEMASAGLDSALRLTGASHATLIWSDGIMASSSQPRNAGTNHTKLAELDLRMEQGTATLVLLRGPLTPELEEDGRARLTRFAKSLAIGLERAMLMDRARQEEESEAEILRERARIADQLALALTIERSAHEEVEELERVRSDFIASVSHELRTPATVIKGFAATLMQSWDRLSDEERRSFVEIIRSRSDDLEELLDELLDFTRWEGGHAEIHQDLTKPKECLDEVVSALGPGQAARVRNLISDDVVVVMASSALRRVLSNLVSNALKFSDESAPVLVSAVDDGHKVEFAVKDQGVGVDPAEMALIFERFYRVNRTDSTASGTGIGLTLVKGFVEAGGGRVWAESLPGAGSTFFFSLPSQGGSEPSHKMVPGTAGMTSKA